MIFHIPTVAEHLHGDLLLKPLTDSDNTGFSNHIEKGASVDEVTKTTSRRVFLPARYASKAESYIDNYVGEWADPYGRRLRIAKVNATTASVSLFAQHQPLARPWYEHRPSAELPATYDPADSPELVVELWAKDKGFVLHLNFEPDYELDKERRDSLTVALSRFEENHFLHAYYYLFQPLSHYVKTSG